MRRKPQRIRQGDIVKVVWKDATEGPKEKGPLGEIRLRGPLTSTTATIGRYLRTFSGYLILEDVFYEESDGVLFYEKEAKGKWMSIPLRAVDEITPAKGISSPISKEAKRRRIIFKQLKLLPRLRRLPSGEISRILYIA